MDQETNLTPVPLNPATPIPLEFTVISEPWAKYKLEDGTRLFLKLVVAKVVRGFNELGQPGYSMNGQNVMSTHGAQNLRGQPSLTVINPADPSSFKAVASLDFERVGPERWNEYHLADGTVLKARLELQNVTRTDRFAADGDPIYLANTAQPLIRFKISDAVLKLAQSPVKRTESKAPYA